MRSRNGALPLSAGRDRAGGVRGEWTDGAAMEPCPYRQGELPGDAEDGGRLRPPQWSPALIGRERRLVEVIAVPYERPAPQWSPALIGRERRHRTQHDHQPPGSRNGGLPLSAGRVIVASKTKTRYRGPPQWSPALIGRESRAGQGLQPGGTTCRNGALPLSAGRETSSRRSGRPLCSPQWSPALIGRERPQPVPVPGPASRRHGALPLSAGREPSPTS